MSIKDNFVCKLLKHEGFRRYSSNISWMMGEKVFRLFVNLFVGVWVARFLGPSKYGIINYVQSLVFIFSVLSTLGLDEVVVKKLVNNRSMQDSILGTAFFIKLIGAFVVLPMLLIVCWVLNVAEDIRLFVMIYSLTLLLGSFNVIDLFFQSKVLSRYTSLSGLISFSVVNIVKVILIYCNASLVWFIATFVLESAILTILFIYFFSKRKKTVLNWKFDFVLCGDFLKNSWPLIFSSLFIAAFMKIDQVMIKEMVGNKTTGVYAAAAKISEIWYFIPISITSTLFPAIINAKKVSQKLYYQRLEKLYIFLVSISLVVAVFISFFGESIVLLLYGRNFLEAAPILQLHIWSGIFVSIGLANGKWLLVENLQKFSMFNTGVGAVVNIGLNLILIPRFGGKGAAIATFVSHLLATYLCLILFRKTRKSFFFITKSLFLHLLFKKILRLNTHE